MSDFLRSLVNMIESNERDILFNPETQSAKSWLKKQTIHSIEIDVILNVSYRLFNMCDFFKPQRENFVIEYLNFCRHDGLISPDEVSDIYFLIVS